jgi:lysophospholipase L1-like esterase
MLNPLFCPWRLRREMSGSGLCLLLAVGCRDATDSSVPGALPFDSNVASEMPAGSAGTAGSGAVVSSTQNAPESECASLPTERCVNAGGLGAQPAGNDAAPGRTADAGAPPVSSPPSFAPCPADGSPCVVMPFGDSITEGFPTFNGGYRVELFHQAVLGGHPITFVGDRANGPQTVDGLPFPRGSEGYSGYTIDTSVRSGITPRAEPAIATYHPHIILLMIGTNDIDLDIDVANAPARLGALINRITTAAPAALLVVATILPTTNAVTNQRIETYDAAIPAVLQSRSAAGQHVIGVDMYAAFTANPAYASAYMVDTLHPNAAGYALLGQTWYTTLEPYLR